MFLQSLDNQNYKPDKEYFSSSQEGVEVQKPVSTQTGEREQHNSEAIAIIGIGCRFTGANDYEQFWLNLEAGVNSISNDSEADGYVRGEGTGCRGNFIKTSGQSN